MIENFISIDEGGKTGFSPKKLLLGETQVFKSKNKKIIYEIFLVRFPPKGDIKKKIKKNSNLYAFKNLCPHKHVTLDLKPGVFLNYEKNYIQCSTHGALFRIQDGYCVKGPCAGKYLEKIDFIIKNDEIIFFIDK